MTLYSVYARSDAAPAVVPDRFSWFAAVLPPVFALVHGLWLLLAGYVVAVGLLLVAGLFLGAEAGFWLYLLLALLVGLEAGTFQRLSLGRRGWAYRTDIVAGDADLALKDYLRRG